MEPTRTTETDPPTETASAVPTIALPMAVSLAALGDTIQAQIQERQEALKANLDTLYAERATLQERIETLADAGSDTANPTEESALSEPTADSATASLNDTPPTDPFAFDLSLPDHSEDA